MGLKAAVQALKKAEELKARVVRHNDLLNNSEAWSDQQQLQTVYHQVLVLDLEYALDKKVEQELWTLGFKNHIAALQHLSRDKKNPRRSECQALLSWCLEAASGFYLTLLQELCSTFELDLPFRRRSAVYGQTKPWPNSEQLIQPHKTSCLYICQYCLVHLGDIARYRSQRKQAESFYRHAILLSPSSGQPYNQLALLEASRGDKLATVFHYVRSICVKYPFPAAATNLANTFSALVDTDVPVVEHHSKLTQSEFISMFLRVHGLLHSALDLNQAETYIKTINATFTALVATHVFSSIKLIQMTAINLYALRHTTDSVPANQLTKDELKVRHLILEMLAGALSAYLLPIYTMSDNNALLDYYALPAIKLTLDWIKTVPNVLNGAMFTKRLQLWPSLCKLLNNLQNNVTDFNANKYEKVPLPEDRDLQCFLPLTQAFKDLDFAPDNLNRDSSIYSKLRTVRLVALGSWLCTQHVNNTVFITSRNQPNTSNIYFEPEKKQPDPTTELLEELKFFSMQENSKAVSKDSASSFKTSPKGTEKRGGILKPQGSLEKSREEREQALLLSSSSENENSSCNTSLSNSSLSSTRSETLKSKRTRQNVAMQALAKRVEESNKQVTFQTEPLVKTIENPQKKNETNNLLPDISKERPNPINLNLNSNFQLPNDMHPNQSFPNTNPGLNINYNQNQSYPRVNVGNMPFPMQFPNNSSNMLYHNNIPQNNMQFNRQPLNMQTSNPAQTVGYQPTSSKTAINDPFNSWILDDKLPLPPTTWWSNNQKPPPHRSYPASQHDSYKQPFPYNVNSGNSHMNFVQDNLKPMDSFVHYNSMDNTSGLNNISVWNTGPSMQSNLQMLFNQQGTSSIQPTQTNSAAVGNEANKMQGVRETTTQNLRECNENPASTMPGYSLFNSNWAPNLVHSALQSNHHDRPLIRQQSLFSGPGPSPLERLLEQQKQMRGGLKDDT